VKKSSTDLFYQQMLGNRIWRGNQGPLAEQGARDADLSAMAQERTLTAYLNRPITDPEPEKMDPAPMTSAYDCIRGLGLEYGDERVFAERLRSVANQIKGVLEAKTRAREIVQDYSQNWPPKVAREILERSELWLKQQAALRSPFQKGQENMKPRFTLRKSKFQAEILCKGLELAGCPDCKLVKLSDEAASKEIGLPSGEPGFEGVEEWLSGKEWVVSQSKGEAPEMKCPECGKPMVWLEELADAKDKLPEVGESLKSEQAYMGALAALGKSERVKNPGSRGGNFKIVGGVVYYTPKSGSQKHPRVTVHFRNTTGTQKNPPVQKHFVEASNHKLDRDLTVAGHKAEAAGRLALAEEYSKQGKLEESSHQKALADHHEEKYKHGIRRNNASWSDPEEAKEIMSERDELESAGKKLVEQHNKVYPKA
jgi:hypothetical protein